MKRSRYAIVLVVCLSFSMGAILAGPALGDLMEDCLDQDLDSCDFLGFSKLCHALASNPQPCTELCRSVYHGDNVGNCLQCCEQIIPQLGMDPQWQVETE